MKRRVLVALASCGLALAIVACACACAKTPDAAPNARAPEPLASDGQADADPDARVPGLPMPQKFPHFVWDAAGATH